MGNQQYREDLTPYLPPLTHYTRLASNSPFTLYRHNSNAQEIMEYQEVIGNREAVDRKLQSFFARHQHLYIVSTLYLKVEASGTCTTGNFTLSIFYQRVVTNLSKINDIPFQDSLHCYSVALIGFQLLYKSYGYFEVFENMFHICQKGKLKVWCNQHIFKYTPEQYVLGEGREEDMVLRIISIIDSNTDQSTLPFNIKDALLKTNKLTFALAITSFRNICRQNKFFVSEYLESLQNSAEIESLLDIYIPHEPKKMEPFNTGITFNPNKQTASQPVLTPSLSTNRKSLNHIPAKETVSERGYSYDASNNSQRTQHKVDVTTATKFKNQSFSDFTNRKANGSSDNSSRQYSSKPYDNRPSSDIHQGRVEQPQRPFLKTGRGVQAQLKKRGLRDGQKYPDKVLYDSRANRPQGHLQPTPPQNNFIMRQFNPSSQPSNSTHQPLEIASARPMHMTQGNHFQERHTLIRSHSQNSLRLHPKITFSQPKVNAVLPQRPVNYSPTFQHQIAISNRSMVPNISFNCHPQSSTIKKTSRILTFPSAQQKHEATSQIIFRPFDALHSHQASFQPQTSFNSPSQVQPVNQGIYNQNHYMQAMQKRQEIFSITNRSEEKQTPITKDKKIEKNLKFREVSASIDKSDSVLKSQAQQSVKDTKKSQISSKMNTHARQLTLGNMNTLNHQLSKESEMKGDNVKISQLESKISLLQSFSQNKITTNQFLTNHSHAISNVKWEKGSNFGTDSVTSAFRKEFLLENHPKSTQIKPQQCNKKEQSITKKQSSIPSRINYDFLQANPKLLQLIKYTPNSYKQEMTKAPTVEPAFEKNHLQNNSKFDSLQSTKLFETDSLNNFQESFKKVTDLKQSGLRYKMVQQPKKSSENESIVKKELQVNGFKKKQQSYLNIAPSTGEVSEKKKLFSTGTENIGWKKYLKNLDQDILEDIAIFGIDSSKTKIQ